MGVRPWYNDYTVRNGIAYIDSMSLRLTPSDFSAACDSLISDYKNGKFTKGF